MKRIETAKQYRVVGMQIYAVSRAATVRTWERIIAIGEKRLAKKCCPNCGTKMVEVTDSIAGRKTGYLWRCDKCMPKNISLSIG